MLDWKPLQISKEKRRNQWDGTKRRGKAKAAAEGIAISLAGVYERIERDEKSQKETSAKNEQAHKQARSRGGEEMEL